MKIPNLKDYTFLWLVHNWTYFDTSFWLVKNYTNRDFIITCKDKEWKTYISKKERKSLAKLGLLFFQKRFNKYEKEVNDIKIEARKFFRRLKNKKLSSLTNFELKKDFLETVNFCQSMWRVYWFTQYFLYDGIEQKIKENPNKNKNLVKKVKEMQKIKFELRKFVNKTMFQKEDYVFGQYFKEIEKRTKRKNLHSLGFQEIADLIINKQIKSKADRKNYVLGKFNNWQPITGKKALLIINKFNNTFLIEKSSIIKGQIANKGYYKGRVRIINFDLQGDIAKESAQMKKGEVLVTCSTIPQMILACHKAGAIVTEEGGIASHASILSRELNKPCIIATKIATQVLKNGDLVEVDANKGIVKKLK